MYIPDSYYAASRQSWGAELIGKSFDQLYVKYQMELLSKQLKRDMEQRERELKQQITNFFEDVTGASALRTLTSPDTSPLDALIALSSISLPGVKGKPGNPLKTQKAGKTLKLTSTQAGDLANYLGFKIVKGASIKKQPVYTNGKIFISPDVDSHIGGVWKAAKTIKDLGSKETRYGTYDVFLNYVGK
ncbi:Novel toxin 21 [Fontibacillus panacisegetis]|uniref:Novel toxin 21 n=1 Tax=Fontibacillus panacisegetis TaxID=670482 RepID=A0A1G7VIL1_9BACL|nr:Novel toxin 21 [Fontibacillus panacisegetis]